MPKASVQIDADVRNRSLSEKTLNGNDPGARKVFLDPVLSYWDRLKKTATQDAKRTRNGMPTGLAILARWWIVEHRPAQSDRDAWATSFEACCSWLGLDVVTEREKLRVQIDAAWAAARDAHWLKAIYEHRAAVMTCAGEPTAIQRQFALPLVADEDYRDISMVEDEAPQLELLIAAV